MSGRIALVIPTYNRRDWLIEALQSALDQEMPADEIVVVDDGSNDGTREAMQRFDAPVRYLEQTRQGAAAAKNLGVAQSESEWVQFLDSDDRLAKHATSRVRAAIAKWPDAGLLAYRAREMSAKGLPLQRVVGKKSAGERYSSAGLLRDDAGGCSWFAVRRENFDAVGGFDSSLRSAEECDLALRLSFICELYLIDEPLLLRRLHGTMLSGDRRLNAECWIRILARLREDQPQWVSQHRTIFNRSWGKEHWRLAKALRRSTGEEATLRRDALRVATRHRPLHLRGWLDLLTTSFGGLFSL
jgi:glycosyltransferase involved in cell wall biosynthesis